MAERQTASILFFFQPKRRNQDVEDDGLNNAANSSDNNHESDGDSVVSEDLLPQAAVNSLEPHSLPSMSMPILPTQIMPHQVRREFSDRDNITASIVAHKSSRIYDEIKYSLLCNRKPTLQHNIPDKFYRDCRRQGGTTKRSLNRELLDEFLGYFEEEELYCLACVLFLTEPKEGASYAKKLISEAYDDRKHDLKNACKASVPSRLGIQNAVFC